MNLTIPGFTPVLSICRCNKQLVVRLLPKVQRATLSDLASLEEHLTNSSERTTTSLKDAEGRPLPYGVIYFTPAGSNQAEDMSMYCTWVTDETLHVELLGTNSRTLHYPVGVSFVIGDTVTIINGDTYAF